MLRLALAALALIAATPVATASQPAPLTIPADLMARAKFPADDPGMVDAVAFVNHFVNDRMTPIGDKEHYGLEEFWVMAPADMKGDCEDYALTKLMILSNSGFPIVPRTKLVGVMVHHIVMGKDQLDGHMILAIELLPGNEVAYLDNRYPNLMTREELVEHGYEFFDWRA